jgi:3-oxoacyl-[acyl-carrier-protein] synthase II
VFGEHAYKVPISSTKSCLGHMLGATAAVELIAAVKAINKSVIPPTINLDNPDERCDLKMDYVPWTARETKVDIALSNSFGFGGHNACIVVGKV